MSHPNDYYNEEDCQLEELMEERESYDRFLCKQIAKYDPELAQEVLAEFGLRD